MIKGYCRVSTKKQLKGYGLEAQREEILSKYPDIEIVEEQYTGSTTERPLFTALVDSLTDGDTLVVAKLDRLARDTVEGIEAIKMLFSKGVSVHILNVGLLEDTPMGKFFLTTLLAVAEMERSTIIERMASGKEVARQRDDYREGRPVTHKDKAKDHALTLLETHTIKEVVEMTGISKATLMRHQAKRKLERAEEQRD